MKKIIVLCTGNSCRSQIAEGYLRKYLGDKAEVFSAGVKNHEINQNAVNTMKDDGIDISNQTSNNVSEYLDIDFDFIITVCDNANETCPVFQDRNAKKIHRNFNDPSKINNGLYNESFDLVRDEIKNFITEFIKSELT